MKKLPKTLLFTLSTLALLTGCSTSKTTSQSSAAVTDASAVSSQTKETATSTTVQTSETKYGSYKNEDFDASYDEASATTIELSKNKATITGDGAKLTDDTVTISAAGTYILSGTFEGQIVVDACEATVHLVLNGVSITNSDSSAILVEQAEKVITTLADGTENTLEDGKDYVFATGEDEPDATFFSKDDLTINGTGSLMVNGNYSNGIRGKDDLVIVSGTIKVTAINNAIKSKDSLSIAGGSFDLTTTAGDGLQANNTEDAAQGWIGIDGGTFAIQAGNDGIQAETNLNIATAELSIKTGDGATMSNPDAEASYKGLKAGNTIVIDDGTYTIDSADDSIHANNAVTIANGSMTLASGDDGIHADQALTIDGGQVVVTNSYEGLEGSTITITGGEHQITATDDGINAGGGSDTTETAGQFGADSFGGAGGGPGGGDQADETKSIKISGGLTQVKADGDGVDSNGNITLTNGTLLVDGPTNGGNGALDYNGEFVQEGGILIAAGSQGMTQATSDTSTQPSLSLSFSQTQAANTLLNVVVDGKQILSYTPSKEFGNVVISTPEMKKDGTVTVSTGGKNSETATANLSLGGTYTEGTELGTYTLSDTVTSLDQEGNAVSANQMGAPGGGQGMGEPGGGGF
ncbi:hypothetical protein BAU15_15145 [Enterococcus sp. JM4C]|uniref:carbohydrate-binding domain-containing protein n=1 Tax=Candidatus Enterococcus huntleyi TaxID=1857217 RepID=UPI00137A5A5E|nr:carbohydrate-binding domain-containing protein [Enterococcus sp. JM4C]KAF1296948.1 hypothetical protein BAU15_15145 [Enterococcus sp. JM4C]